MLFHIVVIKIQSDFAEMELVKKKNSEFYTNQHNCLLSTLNECREIVMKAKIMQNPNFWCQN